MPIGSVIQPQLGLDPTIIPRTPRGTSNLEGIGAAIQTFAATQEERRKLETTAKLSVLSQIAGNLDSASATEIVNSLAGKDQGLAGALSDLAAKGNLKFKTKSGESNLLTTPKLDENGRVIGQDYIIKSDEEIAAAGGIAKFTETTQQTEARASLIGQRNLSRLQDLSDRSQTPQTGVVVDEIGNEITVTVQPKATGQIPAEAAGKAIGTQAGEETAFAGLPPLQKLNKKGASAKFIDAVTEIPKTNTAIERVLITGQAIPEGMIGGVKTAIQKDNLDLLRSPELQAFKAALELYIQSVVKEKQGARPSDTDRKVIAEAIGNIAAGRTTFEAGINELQIGLEANRTALFEQARKGFNTNVSTLPGFEKFIEAKPVLKFDKQGNLIQ